MTSIAFDTKTAHPRYGRFGGSPYTVWADTEGNLQLVCISEYDSGNIFLSQKTYEAFKALSCSGTKSIRFRHASVRLDETRSLDELQLPTPIEKDGKPPFYLIGRDDLPNVTSAYPAYAGDKADIPF
ncbi:MAG: hypothetical protein R3D51_00520 [Hyphomicrobiaceae bacterium]